MRTPLTYYGGKQRLAAQITALMPAHSVYFEPFAGGAAVLFAKSRVPRETLNDLDGEVVAFWRALRDRPEDLARAVELTPYGRAEWTACRRGDVSDDIEAARRLLVDIDQSFGRARSGWSPPSIAMDRRGRWQPGVWENMPAKLVAAADRLRGVALEHGDAIELIPRWDQPRTLIYVDPPYTGEHRLTPEKGYRVDDHDGTLWDRLVEVLADVREAYVILSGYPCEQAARLGWRMVPLVARRTVQELGTGTRGHAPEVVWLSPNVPDPVESLFDAGALA